MAVLAACGLVRGGRGAHGGRRPGDPPPLPLSPGQPGTKDTWQEGRTERTLRGTRGTGDPHRARWCPDMNDLVTTVRCPRCNGPAAVGWSWSEDPPGARAVEFVCPSGCRLTPGELADRFPEMHGRLQHPAPIGTAGPWPDAEAVGPCPTPRATTEPAIWARRRYLI